MENDTSNSYTSNNVSSSPDNTSSNEVKSLNDTLQVKFRQTQIGLNSISTESNSFMDTQIKQIGLTFEDEQIQNHQPFLDHTVIDSLSSLSRLHEIQMPTNTILLEKSTTNNSFVPSSYEIDHQSNAFILNESDVPNLLDQSMDFNGHFENEGKFREKGVPQLAINFSSNKDYESYKVIEDNKIEGPKCEHNFCTNQITEIADNAAFTTSYDHMHTSNKIETIESDINSDDMNLDLQSRQAFKNKNSNNENAHTNTIERSVFQANWEVFEPTKEQVLGNYGLKNASSLLPRNELERENDVNHKTDFLVNDFKSPNDECQNFKPIKYPTIINTHSDTSNIIQEENLKPRKDNFYILNASFGSTEEFQENSQKLNPREVNKINSNLSRSVFPNSSFKKSYSDGYIESKKDKPIFDNIFNKMVSAFESKESIASGSSLQSDQFSDSDYSSQKLIYSEQGSQHEISNKNFTKGILGKNYISDLKKDVQKNGQELIINASNLIGKTGQHRTGQDTVSTSTIITGKNNALKVGVTTKNKNSPVLLYNYSNNSSDSLTTLLPQITRKSNYDKPKFELGYNSPTPQKTSSSDIKRKYFSKHHSSPNSASMPDELRSMKIHNNQSQVLSIQENNTIHKSSSSLSLRSDNSLDIIASNYSHRDSHRKFHKLKKLFSIKGNPVFTPFDDSMEFGVQDSVLSTDESQNKNKNIKEKVDKKKMTTSKSSEELINQTEKEKSTETRTAVYKRRWYLLFLFSVSALLWNAVWSTWGPIAQSAKPVYDWTDADIAMFIWLGNIPFLITMFPSSYLMDVSGMRKAMIAACFFMFLGSGLRCIPSDAVTATWLIRIGQFLNGMAGTIPNSGPALLSALWFPPNQRASATAISTVAGYMGASISFIIGPLIVPEPNDLSPINDTDQYSSSDLYFGSDINNNTNSTDYDAQKSGIMTILYAEFAVAGLLLLLVLIYFPSKPPLPPSISASIPREKYIKGIKILVRNKQFWVCALAFSVPIGVYEAWQVILDVNLNDSGISQETSGWLDFYATLGGCISGLLVSRFADFFTRQMKLFLLIFYIFASIAILWFTLVVLDILPFDDITIYAAIIIAGVFLDGGGPLFFELTIEVSYPVGEGVTSGFAQMLCAAAGLVFLSLAQIEVLGKQWMNWCFFGCVAVAVPLLFFINTTYGRADIDDVEEGDESDVEDGLSSQEPTNSSDKEKLVT